MKKTYLYISVLLVVAFSAPSCKKFLDINENPNSATSGTPELILPQAIVRSANLTWSYNGLGNDLMGYTANVGGVGGWGSTISYNFSNSSYSGLFSGTYKANEDLLTVITMSEKDNEHNAFIGAAKIMMVFNYQSLVDTYNDVPYTEALLGTANLQPKYDKAEDIYKALADTLDKAITIMKSTTTNSAFKTADPLFTGDITKWIKFANTIKLRLIIRSNGKVTFANSSFDAAGFLTEDAMVNPGYSKDNGKQNPTFNSMAYSYSGSAVAYQRVPTPYFISYFDNTFISDPKRATMYFNGGVNVRQNQLGYVENDAEKGISPSVWYIATEPTNNATNYAKIGLLKGPDMGQPIMLASESYFLQAQANLKNLTGVPGTVKSNFEAGIFNSFKYLEKDNTNMIPADRNPEADFQAYLTSNAGNKLVDIDAATNDEQKLEAIISQQYVAYNQIISHQAWFEFQRTGYPLITGQPTMANKKYTFVSLVSEAKTPNKLPTRILYPQSEINYNSKNVPTADFNTSKIFWSK